MPNLKVKPEGTNGRVTHVTPESAGWTYVGFDMHRLKPGDGVGFPPGTSDGKLAFVIETLAHPIGDYPGEANRLRAELHLRVSPPDQNNLDGDDDGIACPELAAPKDLDPVQRPPS